MGEKGVVLEVAKGSAIVLTEQGEFREIKTSYPFEIGQEIALPSRQEGKIITLVKKVPRLYAAAGVLLVLAASFLAPSLLDSSKVVAYVGLEMMPSIELGVDSKGRVTEVIAHDDKAKELIAQLNVEKKSVTEVAGELASRAVKSEEVKPGEEKEVLITVVPLAKEKASQVNSTKLEQTVKAAAQQKLAKENIAANVETITTDEELRTQAKELGLSTGKYVILLKARESGLELEAEDLKEQDVETAIEKAGGNPQEIIDKAQKEGVKPPAEASSVKGTISQPDGESVVGVPTGSAAQE